MHMRSMTKSLHVATAAEDDSYTHWLIVASQILTVVASALVAIAGIEGLFEKR